MSRKKNQPPKPQRRVTVSAERKKNPDMRRLATALTELARTMTPEQWAEFRAGVAADKREKYLQVIREQVAKKFDSAA